MTNTPRRECRHCGSTVSTRLVRRLPVPPRTTARSGWLCPECITDLLNLLDEGQELATRWEERSLRGLPASPPEDPATRVGELNSVRLAPEKHSTWGRCKRCSRQGYSRRFTNLAPRTQARRSKRRNRARLCRECLVVLVQSNELGLACRQGGIWDHDELQQTLFIWPPTPEARSSQRPAAPSA